LISEQSPGGARESVPSRPSRDSFP
jgi:hypothetical protein